LRLIAATRNRAKICRLEEMVGDLIEVEGLPHDISLEPGDEGSLESGESCEEIAAAKAVTWSGQFDRSVLVVATDGGLSIPALGGLWNPTRTRRFAGEHATDLDRAGALLRLTEGLAGKDRLVCWHESVAIAGSGALLETWSAMSEPGRLAACPDLRALELSGGFWIESIWQYPQFGNRLRYQLSDDQLTQLADHWALIAPQVRAWLTSIVC
jgi:inosine/xanthosine triphosphate pyrophosphatase family protein